MIFALVCSQVRSKAILDLDSILSRWLDGFDAYVYYFLLSAF